MAEYQIHLFHDFNALFWKIGDVICLLPGVLYPPLTMHENLTRANSADYIILRVSDTNLLPPPGIRISPYYQSDLPKVDAKTVLLGGMYPPDANI